MFLFIKKQKITYLITEKQNEKQIIPFLTTRKHYKISFIKNLLFQTYCKRKTLAQHKVWSKTLNPGKTEFYWKLY